MSFLGMSLGFWLVMWIFWRIDAARDLAKEAKAAEEANRKRLEQLVEAYNNKVEEDDMRARGIRPYNAEVDRNALCNKLKKSYE